MFDETLIPTLEEGLQKTRDVQRRLIAKLQEAEAEVALLRLEISALDDSAEQTERSISSLMLASRSGSRSRNFGNSVQIEDEDTPLFEFANDRVKKPVALKDVSSPDFKRDSSVTYLHQNRAIPMINNHFEPVSKRFSDRTITQSCAMLLRESARPLHVNQLYNLLVAGGMKFKGNNPTISVAVSLTRNSRFKKVDRGTFDLVEGRDAYRAAS